MKNLLLAAVILFCAHITAMQPQKTNLTKQTELFNALMQRLADGSTSQALLVPEIETFFKETENHLLQILNNTKVSATTRIEQALTAYALFATMLKHIKWTAELNALRSYAVRIQQLVATIDTHASQELAQEEAQHRKIPSVDDQSQAAAAPALPEVQSLQPIDSTRAQALRAELEFIAQRAPTTLDRHTLEAWHATLISFEEELEKYEDRGRLGFILQRAKRAVQHALGLSK